MNKTVGLIVKKMGSIDDEVVFYNVSCTEEDVENGEHFSVAEKMAKENGFKIALSFDEDSTMWKHIKKPPLFVDVFVLFDTSNGIDCMRYIVECQNDDEGELIRFVLDDFEESNSDNSIDSISVFFSDSSLAKKLDLEQLEVKNIKYSKKSP